MLYGKIPISLVLRHIVDTMLGLYFLDLMHMKVHSPTFIFLDFSGTRLYRGREDPKTFFRCGGTRKKSPLLGLEGCDCS